MYEWILVGHIISVISWMAALFYLPRLFVYHVDAKIGSEQSETFKVMEWRLMKIIMAPAMLASWGFGLWLAILGEHYASGGWFHVKLMLVVFMSSFHGFCAKWAKDFRNDENSKSAKFFRIANEIPTVLMILIVILVIVKPSLKSLF